MLVGHYILISQTLLVGHCAGRSLYPDKPNTFGRPLFSGRPLSCGRLLFFDGPLSSGRSLSSGRPLFCGSSRSLSSNRPLTSGRSVSSVRPLFSGRPLSSVKPLSSGKPLSSVGHYLLIASPLSSGSSKATILCNLCYDRALYKDLTISLLYLSMRWPYAVEGTLKSKN